VIVKAKQERDGFKVCKECTGTLAPMCKGKGKCMDAEDGKIRKAHEASILKHLPGVLSELAPEILAKAATAGGVPAATAAAADAAVTFQEFVMDLEQLQKSLESAEAQFAVLEKRATEAEALIKAKDEEIAKLTEQIEKSKAGGEGDDEEILKSLPEPIRKRIEESERRAKEATEAVEKMQSAAEESEAIAKARTLGMGDPKVVGPLMVRIAKGKTTRDDVAVIEALLKAASAQSKRLFSVAGSADDGTTDPDEILKAKAVERQKARPGMTYEQAYAEVLSEPENASLYSVRKNRARERGGA
jgi:DNA-binding transcriptional ArsR family regulator